MNEILENLGISAIFIALKESVKNPIKKANMKRVMLKIRNQINLVFADDPDFQ